MQNTEPKRRQEAVKVLEKKIAFSLISLCYNHSMCPVRSLYNMFLRGDQFLLLFN